MATNEDQVEDLLDRLILQLKAFSLLFPSEAELREKLEARILESDDESIRRFVRALHTKERVQTGRLVAIALGELLLASILVIGGTLILVPSVVGVNSIDGLLRFFAERVSGSTAGSILTPYLSFVEYAIGVVLVLAAFFSLREAASNLKHAGVSIESGGT